MDSLIVTGPSSTSGGVFFTLGQTSNPSLVWKKADFSKINGGDEDGEQQIV